MSKKVVISSFIGTALEFYDYALFAAVSFIIAPLFFPSLDPMNSLFASIMVFSVGLIARPLGGLLFGFIGDTQGRKQALILSLSFMCLASLIIAFAPTYEQAGIFAPLLLVVARLIQGVSAGGEYNGAAILSLEHQEYSSGFVSGLLTCSAGIGLLLAALVATTVADPAFSPWAWRVPFILGAVTGLVGLYIRMNLLDSPVFQTQTTTLQRPTALLDDLTENRLSITQIFFTGGQSSLLCYLLFISVPILLKGHASLTPELSTTCNLTALASFAIAALVAGILSNTIRPEKLMLASSLLTPFFFAYFINNVTVTDVNGTFALHILFGCLIGAQAGPQHALYQKLFPISTRYRGISFGFSFGTGVLSALTTWIAFDLGGEPTTAILWIATTSACSAMSLINIAKRLEKTESPYSTMARAA
jgi:MHS family proline/betaine transporter-like MFS transporter